MCCAIKPLASWLLEEVVSVTRERCGGQGYLSANRFLLITCDLSSHLYIIPHLHFSLHICLMVIFSGSGSSLAWRTPP